VRTTKRALLGRLLAERGGTIVDERAWSDIAPLLAPVSEDYLRRLLRESGALLAPLIEGVRQDTFDELERTLTALQREYEAAGAAGDRPRANRCRRLVIRAKDHARWAARRGTPDREEMASWMMVWLENPGVFTQWLRLHKRHRGGKSSTQVAHF
jgi:hypothetical protein